MRTIRLPVDMICVCYRDGKPPLPYKFKMIHNDFSRHEIKVEVVLSIETLVIAPNAVYLYHCRTCIDDRIINYDLKYVTKSCRWELCGI